MLTGRSGVSKRLAQEIRLDFDSGTTASGVRTKMLHRYSRRYDILVEAYLCKVYSEQRRVQPSVHFGDSVWAQKTLIKPLPKRHPAGYVIESMTLLMLILILTLIMIFLCSYLILILMLMTTMLVI